MNQARLLRETYRYGKNPECQACSKKLKFMNGTKGATFDHRYGEGKLITCLPSRWMKGFNVHKVVVFERDAFGILCGACNATLPTESKKRQERSTEGKIKELSQLTYTSRQSEGLFNLQMTRQAITQTDESPGRTFQS